MSHSFFTQSPSSKDTDGPRAEAHEELLWFFPKVAAIGKPTRLFEVLAPGGSALGRLDFQVRCIRAYNTILNRLEAVGDPDAGILACAYTPREWPRPLVGGFGRLTGIAVRLAAAEEGPLPDGEDERAVLDMRTAGRLADTLAGDGGDDGKRALRPLERRAVQLFARAFAAYERQRGRVSSILRTLE